LWFLAAVRKGLKRSIKVGLGILPSVSGRGSGITPVLKKRGEPQVQPMARKFYLIALNMPEGGVIFQFYLSFVTQLSNISICKILYISQFYIFFFLHLV